MTRADSPLRPSLTGLPRHLLSPPSPEPSHPVATARSAPSPGPLLSNSLSYVLGGRALRIAVLALVLAGWWLSPEAAVRRLHLVFSAVVVTLLLNPLLAPWVAKVITTEPTYWRVFWILPVPLLLGLALTGPVARYRDRRGQLAAVLLVATFVASVTTRPVLGAANGTRLGAPRLKVPPEYEVARALVARVAPGAPVVAPIVVEQWVTTFHHHPYPAVARELYLQVVRDAFGQEEAARRLAATGAAANPARTAEQVQALLELVDRDRSAGVCLASASSAPDGVSAELRRRGFSPTWSDSSYAIWVRP